MNVVHGKEMGSGKRDLLGELAAIKDKNSHEYKDVINELELALGIAEVNVFGTCSRAIFEDKLAEMSMDSMKFLASRVGVDAFGTQSALKSRLLKAFDTQNASSRFGVHAVQGAPKEVFNDEQKEKMHALMYGK